MPNKLTSGFIFLLGAIAVSSCDQFDLDDLRKKASPATPEISLSGRLLGNGSGLGAFAGTYNQQTNVLAYSVAFASVPFSISVDVLHLHRGAPAAGGPIAYTLPSNTNGTITLTEADEALLLNGGVYIDVEDQPSEGQPLTVISRGAIVRR